MTVPTLYQRIGGEETVAALVGAFYRRVMADEELGPFFARTSIEKLESMQREFFAAALDGPVEYSGRSLSEAHHGRGIRRRHVARFVAHLLATLEDQGLEERDVVEIYARINTYVDEITGRTTVDG